MRITTDFPGGNLRVLRREFRGRRDGVSGEEFQLERPVFALAQGVEGERLDHAIGHENFRDLELREKVDRVTQEALSGDPEFTRTAAGEDLPAPIVGGGTDGETGVHGQ